MINQLRDPNLDEECTEQIACQIGDIVTYFSESSRFITKSHASDLLVNLISIMLPKKSSTNFSRSLQLVMDGSDRSFCNHECKSMLI